MRIRRVWVVWVALAASGLGAWTAGAQTAKDAEKALRTELVQQKFFLRSFSADPETRYEWAGDGVALPQPKLHTLGVMVPQSVNLNAGQVEIKGARMTLVVDDKGKYLLTGNSPMVLRVDLKGGDPVTILPELRTLLFFTEFAKAVEPVPFDYKSQLPWRVGTRPKAKGLNYVGGGVCAGKSMHPTVVSVVDPEFSEEARAARFSGSVVMVVTVEADGRLADPWVAKATGLGLDEQAAKAVLQYVLKPATCDGVPRAVAMAIEVNFSIP
jgi:TonB family protein